MNLEGLPVGYLYGTKEEYSKIKDKKENSLYFCTDTQELYIGDKLFSKTSQILDSIPTDETPGNFGCIYFCEENQSVYLYSEKGWTIISSLKADNLVNGGLVTFNAFKGFKYGDTINLKNIELLNPGYPLGIMDLEAGVPAIINNKNADLSVWDRYAFAINTCMVGGTITDTSANLDIEVSVDLYENLTLVNNKITIDENKIRTRLTEIGARGGFSAEMVEYLINTYGIITKELNADGIEETWYSTVMSMEGVTLAKISVREDLLETRLTISPEASSEMPFLPVSTLGHVSEYMPPALFMSKEDTLCNYGLSYLRCDNGMSNTIDYITVLNTLGVDISLEDFTTDDPTTLIKNKFKEAVDSIYIKAPNLVLLEAGESDYIETPSVYDRKIAAGETDVDEDLKKQWQISVDDLTSKGYMIAYRDSLGEGCTDLNIFDGYSISFNKADYTEKVEAPEIYFKSIDNTDTSIYLSSPSNQKDSKTIEALLNNTSAISFNSNYPHNSLTLYCIKGDVVITEKYNDTLAADIKKAVIDTYNGITRIKGTVDFLLDTEIHPGYYLLESATLVNGPINMIFSDVTYDENHEYASVGYSLNRVTTNKFTNKTGTYELPYSIFMEVSEYPYIGCLNDYDFDPPNVYYMRQFVLKTPGASHTMVQPIIKNIETGAYTASPFALIGGSSENTAVFENLWNTSYEGKMTTPSDFSKMIFSSPYSHVVSGNAVYESIYTLPKMNTFAGLNAYAAATNTDPIDMYTDMPLAYDLATLTEDLENRHLILPDSSNNKLESTATNQHDLDWQISDHVAVFLHGGTLHETCLNSQYKAIKNLPKFSNKALCKLTLNNQNDYPTYTLGFIPPSLLYLTEDFRSFKTYNYSTALGKITYVRIIEETNAYNDGPCLLIRTDKDDKYYILGQNSLYTPCDNAQEAAGDINILNSHYRYASDYTFFSHDDYNNNQPIYQYGLLTDYKATFFEALANELNGRSIQRMHFGFINSKSDNKILCLKLVMASSYDYNSSDDYEEYYFTFDVNKITPSSYFTLTDSPETKDFITSKKIFTLENYENLGYSKDEINYSHSYVTLGKAAGKEHTMQQTPAYYQAIRRVDPVNTSSSLYDILIRNAFGDIIHIINTNQSSTYSPVVYDYLSNSIIIGYGSEQYLYTQGNRIPWATTTGSGFSSSAINLRKITEDCTTASSAHYASEVYNTTAVQANSGVYYFPRTDYEAKGYNAIGQSNYIMDHTKFFTFEDKDGNLVDNPGGTLLNPIFSRGFKMSYEISRYDRTSSYDNPYKLVQGDKVTYSDPKLALYYKDANNDYMALSFSKYSLQNVCTFVNLCDILKKETFSFLKSCFANTSFESNFSTDSSSRLKLTYYFNDEDFIKYFSHLEFNKTYWSISHNELEQNYNSSFRLELQSSNYSSFVNTLGISINPTLKAIQILVPYSELNVAYSDRNTQIGFEAIKTFADTLFTEQTAPQFSASTYSTEYGVQSTNWYPLPVPIRSYDNMLLKIYDKNDELVTDIPFNYCKKSLEASIEVSNQNTANVHWDWQEDETFAQYGYNYSMKLPGRCLISPDEKFVKVSYTSEQEPTYIEKLFSTFDDNLSAFGYCDEINTIKIYCKEISPEITCVDKAPYSRTTIKINSVEE